VLPRRTAGAAGAIAAQLSLSEKARGPVSLTDLIAAARLQDMAWLPSQERVTADLIRPAMPRVVALLTSLRHQVDQEAANLARRSERDDAAAPYPIGYCAVIRDRVFRGMLADPEVRRILDAGARITRVFVILKGLYFQNAIQFGNLYIDVANDSVDPSKPWLEWMDVREVAFENVGDLATLARIAESYHDCRAFPNVFFPLIAPVVPFLGVDAAGRVQLLHFESGSFLKDLPAGLPRLREWLNGPAREMPPLPVEHAEALRDACARNTFGDFPFEFRACSLEEVAAQAEAYTTAFADPARHREILRVLDLLPQAARRLHALSVAPRREASAG
jgi:hypothetical protein